MSQKSQPEAKIEPTLEQCPHAVGHRWETVDTHIKGRGSLQTYMVEQCDLCDSLRINHDVEVVGELGSPKQ